MNLLGPYFVLNASTYSVTLKSCYYEMSVIYSNHVSQYEMSVIYSNHVSQYISVT